MHTEKKKKYKREKERFLHASRGPKKIKCERIKRNFAHYLFCSTSFESFNHFRFTKSIGTNVKRTGRVSEHIHSFIEPIGEKSISSCYFQSIYFVMNKNKTIMTIHIIE